jgi:hypothetical protein
MIHMTVNQNWYWQLIMPFPYDVHQVSHTRTLPFGNNNFIKMAWLCIMSNKCYSFSSNNFLQSLNSRGNDSSFPPSSPDLTPPNVYLWVIYKEGVYQNHSPLIVVQLKENFHQILSAITQNITGNFWHCVGVIWKISWTWWQTSWTCVYVTACFYRCVKM